jgi:cation diffusion facilitator CzcD-associated flavoprotein CzcO
MTHEHVDVLVVGAGISGIGAGYHLQANCPGRSYAILEGRDDIGGTWDLFRYPGVRSDSDMYTLGYRFRPWTGEKAIADGPAILAYLRRTARAYAIDRKIRFGHRVKRAAWSSATAQWTVEAERVASGESVRLSCKFLFMCCGYFDYAEGYTPEFEGVKRFTGRMVHPQKWTGDIEYANKRVVVIGSGATAVTLVPALAREAAHVTMLQRSPTYVVARPSVDASAARLRGYLPARLAHALTRWKNVLLGIYFFNLCRRNPRHAKALILGGVKQALGPKFDVATHFTPRYNPWEQRLCVVPDGDLFEAIRQKRVSVVTDQIDTFTETGLKLRSGIELQADLVVTATGLKLQLLSGMDLTVDGACIDPARSFTYKGMMYSDVPNFASSFGYTNASWTLKSDLICAYVCRLLNHMEKTGTRRCVPRVRYADMAAGAWVDFSSGYFQRSLDKLPKQGSRKPWKLHQNYVSDLVAMKFASVEDGAMEFSR